MANCHQDGANLNGLKLGTKLIRKPSLERELPMQRGSPALDSGAGSSRSDSPRLPVDAGGLSPHHPQLSRQYSPSSFVAEQTPPVPPRGGGGSTPPPPPPPHGPPRLKSRMSPVPLLPSRTTASGSGGSISGSVNMPQRGTSPVSTSSTGSAGRQPMIVPNSTQVFGFFITNENCIPVNTLFFVFLNIFHLSFIIN